MSKLTITTFVTLDGVMQAPGGPNEDPSGGFTYGGWLVPHFDADLGAFMDSVFRRAGCFLLGRGTYEIFAAHWPRVTSPDEPVAVALNTLPKHVVSNTLTEASWQHSTIVKGDLASEVARIKASTDGEVQVHGSPGLIQSLLALDLVDELNLLTFPVVLGTGKRLFGAGTRPTTFELVQSSTTSTGTIIATYRRKGPVEQGSFELAP